MADDTFKDSLEARKAIELLVEAVAKEIKPGVLELKLAASTLRDLLEDPSPSAYSLAMRAFDAIDRDTRHRIQVNAQSAAIIYCTNTGRKVTVLGTAPARVTKSQGSGFLQALNFGGSRKTSPAKPKK